jgi:hypothetical protein
MGDDVATDSSRASAAGTTAARTPASGKYARSVVPGTRYPEPSATGTGAGFRTTTGAVATGVTVAPPVVPPQSSGLDLVDAPVESTDSWLATHTIAPAIRVPAHDNSPRLRHIAAACGWAALLGVVGLAIAVRGFIGVQVGDAASWYEPAILITGGVGIGATVAAFLTVSRRRAPWILLGIASVALVSGMIMTIAAF